MAASDDIEKVSLAMNKVSIQVVGEETGKMDRHCAFCLTLVPGAEVKLCSKCKRRAYCSKECQAADWKVSKEKPAFTGKIHGYGQGHKNWCGLPYGEEDLDWKVTPISGKGLGLVALRDLPPLYRIIVDGMQAEPILGNDGSYTPHHPGLHDLAPLSTTNLSEKLSTNAQYTVNSGPKVLLRICRANHSCDANAACADELDFHVMILFSNRDIKKGEEICLAYVRFNNLCEPGDDEYYGKSLECLRATLSKLWGISCPPSCPCLDPEKLKMLKMCKDLYEEDKLDTALPKMEKIIETAGKVGCGLATMNRLFWLAGSNGLKFPETFERGKDYLKMYFQFNKAIYHPKNLVKVVEWENGLRKYGILD